MMGVSRAWRTAARAVHERFAALAHTLDPAHYGAPRRGDFVDVTDERVSKFADWLRLPADLPPPPAWLPPSLEGPLNYYWVRGCTEPRARREFFLDDDDLRPLRRAQLDFGPLGAIWLYAAVDVQRACARKFRGVFDFEDLQAECVHKWWDREATAARAAWHGEAQRAAALAAELPDLGAALRDFPPVRWWVEQGRGSAAEAADAVEVAWFVEELPEYTARSAGAGATL
jgi:hypothetical protein